MIDFEDAPTAQIPTAKPREGVPEFLKKLNDPQRQAVLATDGPLIVLAGAGSGKTRMLTSRVAYLMGACGVPGDRILAVTFTNKAAQEMAERVQKTLTGENSYWGRPEIGTFHAVCVRILRRELDRTPFTKPFVIYDTSDQLALIKNVLNQLNIDHKAVSPKAVQSEIDLAKCEALEPKDIDESRGPDRRFKTIYELYQKELFANGALDFGEIICMTYRLFRDHPDVRTKYQQRFSYIHVDEYQDTNRAQYLLLSLLADRRYGGHQNICVVGDEDQSIYKWRGADIRNILDFEHDYPGATIIKLEQNYRSTKTIITGASHVISHNTQRKDKKLWTSNEDGAPIAYFQVLDDRTEAELVINEVKRLASQDGRSLDEFAIFYRTHAQSRQFEDILRREKIQYQIIGGLKFYERKEIKDILAYFKVVLNPLDSVSLRRIINVPGRGIGKTTLEKLDMLGSDTWEQLKKVSRGESDLGSRSGVKIKPFVALIERLTIRRPAMLLSEFFHLILDETGYVRELRGEGTVEAQARIDNLEEFANVLREFEEAEFKNLSDTEQTARKPLLLERFLEQSSLGTDEDLRWDLSAVKLMTLHGAKGLEFPFVFMVGMEEGLFPSIRPWEEESEDDIEEERRLCYVGMTRAKERLYMSTAAMRRIWGNFHYQDPARFIAEIPSQLMQVRNLAPPRPAPQQTFNETHQHEAYGAPTSPWVGRHFFHTEYGRGVVVGTEGGTPDEKATVEFKGKVRKKFLLRFIASALED